MENAKKMKLDTHTFRKICTSKSKRRGGRYESHQGTINLRVPSTLRLIYKCHQFRRTILLLKCHWFIGTKCLFGPVP